MAKLPLDTGPGPGSWVASHEPRSDATKKIKLQRPLGFSGLPPCSVRLEGATLLTVEGCESRDLNHARYSMISNEEEQHSTLASI